MPELPGVVGRNGADEFGLSVAAEVEALAILPVTTGAHALEHSFTLGRIAVIHGLVGVDVGRGVHQPLLDESHQHVDLGGLKVGGEIVVGIRLAVQP